MNKNKYNWKMKKTKSGALKLIRYSSILKASIYTLIIHAIMIPFIFIAAVNNESLISLDSLFIALLFFMVSFLILTSLTFFTSIDFCVISKVSNLGKSRVLVKIRKNNKLSSFYLKESKKQLFVIDADDNERVLRLNGLCDKEIDFQFSSGNYGLVLLPYLIPSDLECVTQDMLSGLSLDDFIIWEGEHEHCLSNIAIIEDVVKI